MRFPCYSRAPPVPNTKDKVFLHIILLHPIRVKDPEPVILKGDYYKLTMTQKLSLISSVFAAALACCAGQAQMNLFILNRSRDLEAHVTPSEGR